MILERGVGAEFLTDRATGQFVCALGSLPGHACVHPFTYRCKVLQRKEKQRYKIYL
jgi:hypothetical protein